ncbi:SMP-30/gluconolactonase/LRE family protein [Sphingomonas arenae]|uniref:SMP-30/gluconolactonase/LRE family protein n=1 Tax=Sphingomonas arenae TaxID=2812555 RepID=UPI0019674D2E|nr:SMP-30/gluconolactonase/LRE family protein [Sphingomonas arenae]
MTEAPRVVWEVAAQLGEGPVWVNDSFWFTDIKQHKIHRLHPNRGDRRSWDAPEQIGFVLPASSGGFVAGLQSGLHHFDPGSGEFRLIQEVEPEHPRNRLNDGVVDAAGRLWFGTMDNGERAKSGSFYRFERGQLTHAGLSGVAITNGPAIAPDGRTLYWVDTLERTISACEIAQDGSLGPSRLIVEIEEGGGFPDGPTCDAEGCIWIGLYAGWEARRYSPSGELLERVRFPVANITKLAFGGQDLRTVYATTARQKMSAEEISRQPAIGHLFEFRVDVPGLPCPRIAL